MILQRECWWLSFSNLGRAGLRLDLIQRKIELKKRERTGPWWQCLGTQVQWCSKSRGAWTFQLIMLINLLLLNWVWTGFLSLCYVLFKLLLSSTKGNLIDHYVHHCQPYQLLIVDSGTQEASSPRDVSYFVIGWWGGRGGGANSNSTRHDGLKFVLKSPSFFPSFPSISLSFKGCEGAREIDN